MKPNRFYLLAMRPVSDGRSLYRAGELIRTARGPRGFMNLERAIKARNEYGWPRGSLEIRRGDTL